MVLVKEKHIDQWNRIESLEIDAHKCCQLIFDKDAKAIQEKGSLFNKWHWNSWKFCER